MITQFIYLFFERITQFILFDHKRSKPLKVQRQICLIHNKLNALKLSLVSQLLNKTNTSHIKINFLKQTFHFPIKESQSIC